MPISETKNLTAIRKNKKFIAELFTKDDWPPELSSADNVFSRTLNIFYFSIAPLITDDDNYWIKWGGNFDNVDTDRIKVFFKFFLVEVFSELDLELSINSFYVNDATNKAYIHLSKNPWQFFKFETGVYSNEISTFGTAPKNKDNPSDVYYGNSKVRPVMFVPSLQNKINDVISGINTYNTFTLVCDNLDGFYDDFDVLQFFNTPMKVSKADENVQNLSDFNLIRQGIVNDIKISFGEMNIVASDEFFLFNKDYCKKTTIIDYPNIKDANLNKDIPVAWGTCFDMEPIEVNLDEINSDPEWFEYIVIDKNYITSVQSVRDSDGLEISFQFNSLSGIIKTYAEASTIDATGNTNNNIGEIIVHALEQSENISYTNGFWDTEETDYYQGIASEVGFYFSSGTTRDLINSVLENDVAFLIQKNNGLLTIRRWGEDYVTWNAESWIITQKPEKSFNDATRFFCSSSRISYNKLQQSDIYDNIYLNDSSERLIFKEYKKSYTADFQTDLLLESDALNLSNRIIDRFGTVRESLGIGLGVDTFEVNPLDKINISININNRIFSKYGSWIVKETNPGQDIIKIEGLS